MLLHILIVVEEGELRRKLAGLLTKKDTMVEVLKDQKGLWKRIPRKTSDLLIVTRNLITSTAFEEVRSLKQLPEAPSIVILSEQEDEADRVQLIAAGCEAVLSPELSARKLGSALNAILDKRRLLAGRITTVRPQLVESQIDDFVAESTAMRQFVKLVPRVARSNSSVLILGETGVGKERLAHVLHAASPRKDGPFIAVHCGALPESLLESELFGHEQGAFTGATKSRRGCFELAHQGTIFLDEIGEMLLHLQVKLLRILEDKEIHRVGSEKSIPVDVRIMAATNRDLEAEVKAKQFRRDLYYRLNVVSLTMPPLRERIADIPGLVDSYIGFLGPRIGCDVCGITKEAVDALCRYSWPGNVRELINVIERAMLLCDNDVITCDDLPKAIAEREEASTVGKAYQEGVWPDEILEEPLKDARKRVLEQFERSYLANVLSAVEGRIGQAAKQAGIDTRSLFTKMKRYGLNKKDFRAK
jgi:DNA-binding NtrC family response regulator